MLVVTSLPKIGPRGPCQREKLSLAIQDTTKKTNLNIVLAVPNMASTLGPPPISMVDVGVSLQALKCKWKISNST